MIHTKVDPVFYLRFDLKKRITGMNESYVDDLLRARNSKFKKLCKITYQKFETTPDEDPRFSSTGLELKQLLDDSYT